MNKFLAVVPLIALVALLEITLPCPSRQDELILVTGRVFIVGYIGPKNCTV